jgi:DNA-binding NarL/FixJ family response regulator
MRDRELDSILKKRVEEPVPFHALMSRRITNILLVSSLYDSFTLEEDGSFTEVLFSEYLNLNLRYAPRIVRVSTGEEALVRLKKDAFDLVISMLSIGPVKCDELGRAMKVEFPDLPLVVLANSQRDLQIFTETGSLESTRLTFVWQGDVRLFLAIIKSIEDRWNAEHDAQIAGVKCIILVEDSTRFCSSYLPMLYTELMKQTQVLMADGVNRMQKFMRMRARPKILHARSYEEAIELYKSFRNHVLGVILDVRFEKSGVENAEAGIELAGEIRAGDPSCPILFQSSEESNREKAIALGAAFINKNSLTLLAEVRKFMKDFLGFGDFVFKNPDGVEEARAHDLRELRKALRKVSDQSLLFHALKNHFSTWLMARTEYDLAYTLRPQKVENFGSISELRAYLISSLKLWIDRSKAGQVEDFSSDTFDIDTEFVKIGSGSLGGKGRGLALFHSLLNTYTIDEGFPGVEICIPRTAILATGVFDQFMDTGGLKDIVFNSPSTDTERQNDWDSFIAGRFLNTPLPEHVIGMLRAFLTEVHYPIAVRSSSLLEDSPAYPFAGIYSTYMLPNNNPDIETRLEHLLNAVKLVYASVYFKESAAYIEATPNRLEEEKMAVVIQQVAGRKHDSTIYPDLAGVAKSYNFYPLDGMDENDGVASVALGLGGSVVDGGKCVRFSPESPRKLYQFSSTDQFLKNSQRNFLALDLAAEGNLNPKEPGRDLRLISLDLETAQQHGTLAAVGSVYSAENDMIIDGTYRPGAKLVTMAGVLKGDFFPLAPVLSRLLKTGRAAFSSEVEIEFAVTLGNGTKKENSQFYFLQIRPTVCSAATLSELDSIDETGALCVSGKVLGFGLIEDIQDIIYIPALDFDRSRTTEIAAEIEKANSLLRAENRHSLLIGPGRWGSSDSWLGIPVKWNQISSVKCFVETRFPDIDVDPSQGTHFFQNITSLGIGYFTITRSRNDFIRTDVLEDLETETGSGLVHHIRLEKPLKILINPGKKKGVIRL